MDLELPLIIIATPHLFAAPQDRRQLRADRGDIGTDLSQGLDGGQGATGICNASELVDIGRKLTRVTEDLGQLPRIKAWQASGRAPNRL